MTTNRLAKSEQEPKFDRKSWSPEQHCAHANRQLIENGTNEYRRKMGLFPVKWVLVNDRVTITEGEPRLPVQIPHYGADA